MKNRRRSVLTRIVVAVAVLILEFVSAHAQSAIFFAASELRGAVVTPWGELFVGNNMSVPTPTSPGSYSGISRFTFDAVHIATSHGTVTTPLPIASIVLVPPNSPLTVNSTDDTNDGVCDTINCTLREAINAANAQPGDDTINFSVTGTINLLTPLASLSDTVSFEGPGANQLTIQRSTAPGTPDFGIFKVTTVGVVTFAGLTISNGGGIGTAANSVLGAGIHNINTGTVHVVRSKISGNSGNYGGGIYNFEGTVNITESSILNNVANHPVDDTGGGHGGAIYNYAGTVMITNSLIAGNSAFTHGGGIFQYQGELKVTNTTIFGNSCNGAGGGIHHNDSGAADITNSTLSGNSGSGLYNNGSGGGTATVLNSIVALNSTDVQGSVTSLGYNIIGSGGISPQIGDQLGVNNTQLKLGPLADNGGPTKTMALGFGSLAIDAGNDCVTEISGCLNTPLITDQRGLGFPRKLGTHVDVGAMEGVSDSTAPITTVEVSIQPNAQGWNSTNVTVSFSASDESGGSGVKEIVYSATGAQTIGATTVTGSSASVDISSEGVTTISFYSRDNGNNTEAVQTLTIRLDKTAPVVSCGAADGLWHANDISISCTSNDGISGLTNSVDSAFNLATEIALGNETSNAFTDSRLICDLAGNCATAGPIGGNKVDKKAPAITITAPTASHYLLNQSVTANFSCTDDGSGVGICLGTAATGNSIDTASVGAKSFVVNATDNVGNSAVPSVVNYTVGFGVQPLFDQSKAHKSGSTVPIKVRLVDANGTNVSSGATVVHAVSVVQTGSEASSILDDAGNANPDFDFRYDTSLGAYVFNLKTTGLVTGAYVLTFTVNGSSIVYSVGFQVRQ